MTDVKTRKVLVLFSGGKDSFLSTCKLIEDGFIVEMVTFENGCGLAGNNAEHGANRIISIYGKEKASFLGVKHTSGIWRSFFLPYFNLKPSEILEKFGEITLSQYNCLTCRTSMYIWSICYSKLKNISYIADGARISQSFVIELPIMIEEFKKLFSEYKIELLLPIFDLKSDWELKNSLLLRGFVPKTLEPQCLLGVPLTKEVAPEKDIQEAVVKYFRVEVFAKAIEEIFKLEKTILKEETEL